MSRFDDLDEVLSTFEDRKEQERKKINQRKAQEEEWRQLCMGLLRKTVTPALEELATHLNDRGYEARVERRRLETSDAPCVQLLLTPAKARQLTSSIGFWCANSRVVEVRYQIVGPKKGSTLTVRGDSRGPSLDPKQVTADWVRENVVEFVKKVLAEY